MPTPQYESSLSMFARRAAVSTSWCLFHALAGCLWGGGALAIGLAVLSRSWSPQQITPPAAVQLLVLGLFGWLGSYLLFRAVKRTARAARGEGIHVASGSFVPVWIAIAVVAALALSTVLTVAWPWLPL